MKKSEWKEGGKRGKNIFGEIERKKGKAGEIREWKGKEKVRKKKEIPKRQNMSKSSGDRWKRIKIRRYYGGY